MSHAFIQDVPIDETQYAEIRAAIGPEIPKGLVAHLVIRRDGGLRYIDVWDTETDWEYFREERVNPAVEQMLTARGLTRPAGHPPQERIEVVDTWVADR